MRAGIVSRLLVTLLVVWLPGCGDVDRSDAHRAAETDRAEARPNLLLISVDTLRADHLQGYGYGRPTSPAVDRFLAEAVTFTDAHSTSSWTLPALASLMTSHYPSTHGLWQFDDHLASSYTTLAERLAEAGYRTAAVASHIFLGARFGLAQGFEIYDQSLIRESLESSHEAVTSPQIARKALDFLDSQARMRPDQARPWLLWVHLFDPHEVYREHRGITSKFGTEDVDRYDGEIVFTDRYVGRMIRRLELVGLEENTIVVFVSDHGEEFGEHGGTRHGRTLYDEVERVPLAIRVPGFAPRRVEQPVSLVDVLPTILELLELETPSVGMAGRSLVRAMRGEPLEEQALLLESRLVLREDAELAALVEGDWKLIVETPREGGGEAGERLLLFDRAADPAEARSLAEEQPEVASRMQETLEAAVGRAESRAVDYAPDPPMALTPEELEALRALGYVDGTQGDQDAP